MWLLPYKKRTNSGGTIITGRVGHFRPAVSFKTLSFGSCPGIFRYMAIIAQTFFEKCLTVPECKMCSMPPVHFQMEFAEPAVIGKSRFLWWKESGTLYFGKILGKYNPAFKFFGTRIGAS